jgi:LysR family transcriptional regulator of beta-lactamase
LVRRLPRGLALTDEGQALMPVVANAFDAIDAPLDRYAGGRLREVLSVGVAGTFAGGCRCLDWRISAAFICISTCRR